MNRTYLVGMVVSDSKVARQRFAAFVGRVLEDARDRGMSDPDIAAATGLPPSTFHRWRAGTGGLPQIDKIIRFCQGLEVPPEAALAALGFEEKATDTTELPDDPDVRLVARRLRDPNVPEEEKQAIRFLLRQMARRSA